MLAGGVCSNFRIFLAWKMRFQHVQKICVKKMALIH